MCQFFFIIGPFFSQTVSASKVVDEYNRKEHEIKQLEKDLEEKNEALTAYRQNISQVPDYPCFF